MQQWPPRHVPGSAVALVTTAQAYGPQGRELILMPHVMVARPQLAPTNIQPVTMCTEQQHREALERATVKPVLQSTVPEKAKIPPARQTSAPEQRILLIRHGEALHNVSDAEIPDALLTKTGHAQALSWKDTMHAFGADVVLVSPLRRTVQTACLAFGKTKAPMELCRAARECWWDQVENSILSSPDSLRTFVEELPRGEKLAKRLSGVEAALQDSADDPKDEASSLARLRKILAARPERCVAVVTHWGVVQELCGCDADNAEVVECRWTPNRKLVVFARHPAPLEKRKRKDCC